jgi:hypothetical protein
VMPAASELETYSAGGDDRDTTDVCETIINLAELVSDADLDVARRRRKDFVSGFPANASGASPGGGATNRRHNFATGEDNPKDGSGMLVPQHSDPVGELVVRDAEADDLGLARKRAHSHVCRAMRELEAAQSELARTRPPVVSVDAEDRDVCWPCRDAGVMNAAVHNDGAPKGIGRPMPRCRKHYECFLAELVDAPAQVAVWWAEGRKVTVSMFERARAEERAVVARRGSKRKGKRR